MPPAVDFLVVGAGIVGVNVATVLRRRFPAATVALADKERAAGLHASGRNSGVLHAGLYYTPDSLKARLTRGGNAFLTRYCADKGLPLRRCGKLVVARSEADLPTLEVLQDRARASGVPVEAVTPAQAARIEPLARTHGAALWSPSTSVGDPAAVMAAQLADAVAAGVQLHLGTRVDAASAPRAGGALLAGPAGGPPAFEAGYLVNCAGLHADVLARACGAGAGLRMLPFKGLYMYCDVPLRALVYPAPDVGKPFLGVHFTLTAGGRVKIGPTAIPALWRENYGGRDGPLYGFSPGELLETAALAGGMLLRQPEFRALAWAELRKYSRAAMVADAAGLVPSATPDRFREYGAAGIRAQLVRRAGPAGGAGGPWQLVMDYELEHGADGRSLHVLNAVSPGWTCSRPFAELIVDRVVGAGG